MIGRIVCFFIGMIMGGALSIYILFLLIELENRNNNKLLAKDDWRMP